jgi:acetyl esterase/lipase
MLFFHGGGFVGGPLNQFDRQAQYLATRGLVAIQVQYRLEDAADTAPITELHLAR